MLLLLLLAGCDRERDAHAHAHAQAQRRAPLAAEVPDPAATKATPRPAPAPVPEEGPADELASIEAGTVLLGSTPGTRGRRPDREMDGIPVTMNEFSIERGLRSARGLSHEQAAQICAGDGRRLCTEIEWEWACEGPRHRDRAQPVTAEGVRSMGQAREWTASPWGARPEEQALGWAVRGARPDAPADARRCAGREPSIPARPAEDDPRPAASSDLSDVAFRCCDGDPAPGRYETEPPRGTFMPVKLTAQRFAAIVRSVPELREVHTDPALFSRRDVETALAHPGPGTPQAGWRFGADPLIWTPEQGEQLLVLIGRSGHDSFVAALYRLPGDRFAHAASMVLREDMTPLLLAWGALRRELIWTPCWNCQETEGGKIVYRLESNDVRVTSF